MDAELGHDGQRWKVDGSGASWTIFDSLQSSSLPAIFRIGDSAPETQFLLEGQSSQLLRLRGFVVDHSSLLGSRVPSNHDSKWELKGPIPLFWRSHKARQNLLVEWRELTIQHYQTTKSSLYGPKSPGSSNTFWRTFIADSDLSQDGEKADESLHKEFDQFFEDHDRKKSRWEQPPYLRSLENDAAPRQFFLTEQGYMGLAPREASKGDLVCIFLGGRTPFVIRKSEEEEQYVLIGECYVHEIMDGEAMKDLEAGRYETQDLILR